MQEILSGVQDAGGKKQRIKVPIEELRTNLLRNAQAAEMEATGEHLFALKAIFQDHDNVFLTGDAGTGKTWFVKNLLMEELNNRGLNFTVVATTGIAGSHLEGKTIHSWAGIGLGPFFQPTQVPIEMHPDDVTALFDETIDTWETGKKMFPKQRDGIRNRIRACEVLLYEEVSMCAGAAFLNFIDRFFKHIRGNDKPFGGIQMIMIGDFCQLPPVERKMGRHVDWAFLSKSWAEARVRPIEFTKVFRQADVAFATFLNHRRLGYEISDTERDYMRQFLRPMTAEEALKASYLVPTNKKADDLNARILDAYPAPTTTIVAKETIGKHHITKYDTPEKIRENILKGKVVKDKLSLRMGLPVLLTFNDPNGEFVNGTKGFIHGFIIPPGSKEVAQIQVRIPRSKREYETMMEVWNAEPEKYRGPQPSPDNIVLLSRRRYTRYSNEDAEETIDVVEDVEVDGEKKSLTKQVPKFPFLSQFPIIPASAITIHKSQGMSLDECVVDLKQSFAPGHVYVALSRLRTAAGLTLTSLDFDVLSDPYAMRFYEALREFRSQNTIPL